jgi:hypothetical protein
MGFAALYPSCDCSILPDGQISKKLSSPVCKNISLPPSGKSPVEARPIPAREEGRIAIVTDVGWGCDGRGSVRRETESQGGFP